jgi:hypothetical protein
VRGGVPLPPAAEHWHAPNVPSGVQPCAPLPPARQVHSMLLPGIHLAAAASQEPKSDGQSPDEVAGSPRLIPLDSNFQTGFLPGIHRYSR